MKNEPREMPWSQEAEWHVIACTMLDGTDTVARALQAGITPDSFFSGANRLIWEFIVRIAESGPVTIEVLAQELKDAKMLESIGGFPYLMQITGRIPTTAHVAYFIEKVREKEILRNLIKEATGAVEKAYQFSGGGREEIVEIVSPMLSVVQGEQDVRTFQKHAKEQHERMQAIIEGRRKFDTGLVSFGYPSIDRLCHKMAPGELVILAARPSVGKSSLMRKVTASTSIDQKLLTLVFSMEVDLSMMVLNYAQTITGIGYRNIESEMKPGQQKFLETISMLQKQDVLRVFDKDRTLASVVARARAIAATRKVGFIAVDYLQRMSEPMLKGENRDQMIGRMTRTFKDLASDLECPLLLLSQLNRAQERESNREPMLSDLRESGNIEQDADRVVMLHRPNVNPITRLEQDWDNEDCQNYYVDFLQKKGRDTGIHSVGMQFNRPTARFLEIDTRYS